jgi:Cellulose synthase subunit D.
LQSPLVAYLESQRRTPQWEFVLKSILLSLQEGVAPEALQVLARDAGMRAGGVMVIPPCESLAQMQQAANDRWAELGWGFVDFSEQLDRVVITHRYAPRVTAANGDLQRWVAGFLEGVYQRWFMSLGAGDELRVRQVPGGDADMVVFHFGR